MTLAMVSTWVATAWAWLVDAAGYLLVLAIATSGWWLPAIKKLVDKWLDNRFAMKLKEADQSFARQLKETEQKHDVLVRHLQSSIDREFDRATRLHTQEFEALSKGWKILHKAYWLARQATARGHRIADFTLMSAAQADYFIRNSDLADWQKDELLAIDNPIDRNEHYKAPWWWRRYQQCEDARMKLVMFIDRNSIFLQPEIRAIFDQLQGLINDALIELEMRITAGSNYNEFERAAALVASEDRFYKDLEAKIHARLWSSVR